MFIVIGLLFLAVYGLIVFYIGRTGWSWMKPRVSQRFRLLYIVIMIFLSTSFILAYVFGNNMILSIIGSYWLALFSLLAMLLPIFHLIIWLAKLLPKAHHQLQKWSGIAILIIVLSLISYGSFNAFSPIVREYTIEIDRPNVHVELDNEFRIVLASDMHFNYLSGQRSARRLVAEINALEPDLVLFPGDIIDDDIRVYLDKGLGDILSGIESTYGVYASLGNHDRYSGRMHELIAIFEQSGMRVLYDEVEEITEGLLLIGRKDYSDPERIALDEIIEHFGAIQDADPHKIFVMLDHQPVEYDMAAKAGIDLLVSGHTHYGQIAPAHLITRMIYENDYGYMRKDNLHTVVTSGYGFWGPPIRIGSRSEVVLIKLSIGQ